MSKSPVITVKEKFGDKAKLLAAIQPLTDDALWLPRLNEGKGLARVSNAKLLRLYAVLSEVKTRFGSRQKLIDAICEVEKRAKDEGYKKRLSAYPAPRLYDLYRSSARRHGVRVPAMEPIAALPGAASASSAKAAPAKAKAAPKAKAEDAKAKPKAPAAKEKAAAAPKRAPKAK